MGAITERAIILYIGQFFSKATAEGAGRNGKVKSFGDAPLELKLSMPKSAGGKGDGQNPEQLFAMGYSCTPCLDRPLQYMPDGSLT